jgi:MraZ protein
MFLGEYKHTTDAKHRLIMPAKFREMLGERFIITKGLDQCLFVYTDAEWQALHDKVKGLPVADKAVRRFTRFFFGGAEPSTPDAQGRVLLPPHLREYAGITKEVVSVGVSNRIEIWSKENWID